MSLLRPGLDPRSKLLLALAGIVAVIGAGGLQALALIGIILLGTVAALRATRAVLPFLALVLPMTLFFGLVTTWALGVVVGLTAAVKFLWLALVGFLLFTTTPPEDLANALIKAGLPYQAAFVASAGLQFVPILRRKAQSVLDAQKARGLPLGVGWRALRRWPAFLVPLLVQSFQLAEELAEAMECRGFGRPGRTFYKSYLLRGRDYGVMLGALGAVALFLWGSGSWH